ncbi:hypothetical protein [Lentzea sp. CA-135723]|uniref:hypothetical protein n=1 Tax=Lentzea sp. CA-135723 TaxID=3239950 RepID=UPI003D92CCE1
MDRSSRALSGAGALFFDEAGRLLLVADWAPRDGEDRVLFVFEGGLIDAAEIRLPAEELRSFAFVPPAEAGLRLIPRLARRVAEALRARESGETRYLEHGLARQA